MLDSWLWPFRSFSDGARGLQCPNVFNALKPIVELIACLSRNTTPTERTLKAIKTLNNNEGPTRALEHMNDALLVKSYIAQDTTLLVDASCSFYTQFVETWLKLEGRSWCTRKKTRSDKGKRHTYNSSIRFKKRKLHNMMWKCIDRLCKKYKQDGKRDQKALTGEDLTKLQEKMHGRTDDFSEQQTKYIKHHTEIGPDVKRRKLQERQRAKGTRWCRPGLQAVKKSKVTNHRSLDETKQQLKVFSQGIFVRNTLMAEQKKRRLALASRTSVTCLKQTSSPSRTCLGWTRGLKGQLLAMPRLLICIRTCSWRASSANELPIPSSSDRHLSDTRGRGV